MRINDPTLNRLNVLKAIRRWGPVARTELPELTGLSGGLITQLTSALLERGLIVERRDHSKRPGRPRKYLEIHAQNAVVIGVDVVGGSKLIASFVDLAGKLLFHCDVHFSPPNTLADLGTAIILSLRDAIARSPYEKSEIHCIGIALPAVVDARNGIVYFMTSLPVGPEPFAETISAALKVPVKIENDMSSMARAEHWFGRARDHDTFTLINIGHAFGSARYLDGLPLIGMNGVSAEIGHMKLETGPKARPCYCGGRGCAGTYIAIFGLLMANGMLETLDVKDFFELYRRFEEFLDLAEHGDDKVLALLREAGGKLGISVANHINAVDPGVILILLPNDRLMKFIGQPFQRALKANVMPGMMTNTQITFDLANEDWRWKGVAALALEQTFLAS